MLPIDVCVWSRRPEQIGCTLPVSMAVLLVSKVFAVVWSGQGSGQGVSSGGSCSLFDCSNTRHGAASIGGNSWLQGSCNREHSTCHGIREFGNLSATDHNVFIVEVTTTVQADIMHDTVAANLKPSWHQAGDRVTLKGFFLPCLLRVGCACH